MLTLRQLLGSLAVLTSGHLVQTSRLDFWLSIERIVKAADILQVTHALYDFDFLFDHSAGHDAKQRPAGLNQRRMNTSFAVKTAPMRGMVIIEQEQG